MKLVHALTMAEFECFVLELQVNARRAQSSGLMKRVSLVQFDVDNNH